MTISNVGAYRDRPLTNDELDAVRRDDSTSANLNAARRNAGAKGDDVVVRGDDGTLDEALEHKKMHFSTFEKVELAAKFFEMGAGVGLIHGARGTAAGVATLGIEVGAPIIALIGTQVAMMEMQDTKDGLRDAATRDVLHGAMLRSLELPKNYVDKEIATLGVSTSAQSPAEKIAQKIRGTPLGATIQHHCDQGVLAAVDFTKTSMTKDQFLTANPNVKARYDGDAAFRAGFDGYLAASSEADAMRLLSDVKARDARWSNPTVQVRG